MGFFKLPKVKCETREKSPIASVAPQLAFGLLLQCSMHPATRQEDAGEDRPLIRVETKK